MNITSINNETVKMWSSLSDKKYREKHGLFLIEGDHLVNIALEKNLVVDLILLDDDIDFSNKYIVTNEIMKKISTQKSISKVAATVKLFSFSLVDSNALVLDNLQDPGNMGTIIRSACAFGFKNIIIGSGTVDLYNEKVIRASEGMIFNVNFMKLDLVNSIDFLKESGFTVLGTDVVKGRKISEFAGEKLAIIIGNEGSGMNKNILCDDYVFINMSHECESLNAGVSASILMNEVYNG